MDTVVQARLDKEAQAALHSLVKRHGWSQSQAVRESLLQMERQEMRTKKRRIIGVGIVATGIGDLSTNEKHMEGFGK